MCDIFCGLYSKGSDYRVTLEVTTREINLTNFNTNYIKFLLASCFLLVWYVLNEYPP